MEIHHTRIELHGPIPAAVDAGSNVGISVTATCLSGCDLRGSLVRLMDGDEALASTDLIASDEGESATGELVTTAPRAVDEHTLSIVLESRSVDGVIHDEGRLPVTLRTRAHKTSLAAWGIPSPVVIGRPFEVFVGARCSAACNLGGLPIAVHDEDGAMVAIATLGEAPLPGTNALYWTTIELTPPEREGPASWSVGFAPRESELPHAGSSSNFKAVVVTSPEHRVTIRVTDRTTGLPIEGARALLGNHRGVTDASGIATVAMPKGSFTLVVRKPGYQEVSDSGHVTGTIAMYVELAPESERDEFEDWM